MSERFSQAFLNHAVHHPLLRPEDAVKFAFQSEYGAEHFVGDAKRSRARLAEECASLVSGENEPLFEALGGNCARLNLAPALKAGAALDTVNAMFLNTAAKRRGTEEGLNEKLLLLPRLCAEAGLLCAKELSSFLLAYRERGFPVISHSQTYREAYHPAYRVVDAAYLRAHEVIFRIDALLREKERVDVAIDGGSASGKTTLARLLGNLYDCNVFHADDYFLQGFQRTEERLKEPGGNVDYERLKFEVIDRLGQDLYYRAFDCGSGELRSEEFAPKKRLNIVEGAYSMHPKLQKNYDLAVFLEIGEKAQERRIVARGDGALLKRFQSEWIPMEQRYAEAFSIREKADVVLVTEEGL